MVNKILGGIIIFSIYLILDGQTDILFRKQPKPKSPYEQNNLQTPHDRQQN